MGFLSAVLESAEAGAQQHNQQLEQTPAIMVTEMERNPRYDPATLLAAAASLAAEAADALAGQFVRCQPNKSLASLRFSKRSSILQAELSRHQLHSPELTAAMDLATAAENLRHADHTLERRHLREAAELYDSIATSLDTHLQTPHFQQLILSMRDIVSFKRAKCLAKITQHWRDRLRWISSDTENANTILVNINTADMENLQEISNALFTSDRINVEISRFAEFFLESIVPTFTRTICFVDVKRSPDKISIKIINDKNCDTAPDIKHVIENFILFFGTVQTGIDFKWEDDRTVFSVFGQIASKRFFDMLIDKLLTKTIPVDSVSAETYSETMAKISDLDKCLREIRFCEDEISPLTIFTDSIYDLTYEKKCRNLLSAARDLMKTNLQKEIVTVCTGQVSDCYYDEMEMLEKASHNRNILTDPFLLTQCSISKSVQDIMEIITDELNYFQSYPIKLGSKIILTLRNIVEMYYMLVPKIHEDSLNTNPLDLALYYNNCFYLAHAILGHPWDKVYGKEFATLVNMQLADQAHNIRKSAVLNLSSFIKKEQQLIEDTIINCGINKLEKHPSVESDSERAVMKCLDRLNKLKNNWETVLTKETYETSLCNLINCLCAELVKAVLIVKESILDKQLAEGLADLYEPVIKNIPELFSHSIDFEKSSKHYCRLREMSHFITCPITMIPNLWTSKTSLVSKYFTCEEMKHFVRIMSPGNPQKSTVLDMIL